MNLHKKRFIYPPLFKSRYNNKRISFEICVKRNWIVFKNQCVELKKTIRNRLFPTQPKVFKSKHPLALSKLIHLSITHS